MEDLEGKNSCNFSKGYTSPAQNPAELGNWGLENWSFLAEMLDFSIYIPWM